MKHLIKAPAKECAEIRGAMPTQLNGAGWHISASLSSGVTLRTLLRHLITVCMSKQMRHRRTQPTLCRHRSHTAHKGHQGRLKGGSLRAAIFLQLSFVEFQIICVPLIRILPATTSQLISLTSLKHPLDGIKLTLRFPIDKSVFSTVDRTSRIFAFRCSPSRKRRNVT